jgi:hypothetical protein
MAKVDITNDLSWGTAKEQEAMSAFEAHAPADKWQPFTKMGKYSHFDFCAIGNDRKHQLAFAEIKSRRCKRNTYPDTIVPSVKIQKGLELLNLRHKVYVILNFEDEICFVDLKDAQMRFGYNARTDRGALELGHYAFIPLDQCVALEKKEKNDSKKDKAV